MDQNRDLELLYELGCIRFIPRAWKNIFQADFANLAEHHFRVAWLAMLISNLEGKGDTGKIVKMALAHDITESRTGDVHAISRQYTKRDEDLAIKDILKSTTLETEMVKLWEEYEERKTVEAQIVKDADFLEVDLELVEQISKGRKDLEQWIPHRKVFYDKFFFESTKKLWQQIHASNPGDWYLNSRSRFTEGDMSK